MHSASFKLHWCGHQLRVTLKDYVVPFFIGFACAWTFVAYELLDEHRQSLKSEFTTHFLNKNGQAYLHRHGFEQKRSDDKLEFSIQAEASENFKTLYIPYPSKSTLGTPEPPGTIWPWSRLEKEAPSLPIVWVVTPTFRNPYQYADLTRVAQALYPARRFVYWLIVDDLKRSETFKYHIVRLNDFIQQFGVNYTILRTKPIPRNVQVLLNPKGVEARRAALEHIRQHNLRGVIYFADDDNTYDSDIFRQATKTVSIWPTGAITGYCISSPVVAKNGTVIDFFDGWVANRKFPVDFASFAVNADLVHNNLKANIPWHQGYEETLFLANLNISKSELLPLAANATQVLAWHTKTVKLKSLDAGPVGSYYPVSVKALMAKYDFLFDGVVKKTKKKTKENRKPQANKLKVKQ